MRIRLEATTPPGEVNVSGCNRNGERYNNAVKAEFLGVRWTSRIFMPYGHVAGLALTSSSVSLTLPEHGPILVNSLLPSALYLN